MSALLSSGRRVGAQRPRIEWFPPHVTSAGYEVIELMEALGRDLDEWQRRFHIGGLGELADGSWAATWLSLWLPRQNGKTDGILQPLALAGLFLFGERKIVWSAHEYKTIAESFQKTRDLVRSVPELHEQVAQYRETNGEQGIWLRNGAKLQFSARTKSATRGFAEANRLLLDEGQELTEAQMAAVVPTTAATSMSQAPPQVVVAGTPPDNPAAWCYTLRADGEAQHPRTAHMDFGLDLQPDKDGMYDPAELADRDGWYAANPALGVRISELYVEDEMRRLGQSGARERLGVWLPRRATVKAVISAELWASLADPEAQRPARVAFAVAVRDDRQATAIGWAGRRDDGRVQVGVAAFRPGTAWAVPWLAERRETWAPVAVGLDPKSPAGSLLLDLDDADITQPEDRDDPKPGDLALTGANDVAAAFGLLVDAAANDRIRHLDEGALNAPATTAGKRLLAGRAAIWDPKDPADITALQAVTLAHWAFLVRENVAPVDYDLSESFA